MGGEGIYSIESQMELVDKQVKLTTKYRKEFLSNLTKFISKQEATDVILAVDFNQSIESSQIK